MDFVQLFRISSFIFSEDVMQTLWWWQQINMAPLQRKRKKERNKKDLQQMMCQIDKTQKNFFRIWTHTWQPHNYLSQGGTRMKKTECNMYWIHSKGKRSSSTSIHWNIVHKADCSLPVYESTTNLFVYPHMLPPPVNWLTWTYLSKNWHVNPRQHSPGRDMKKSCTWQTCIVLYYCMIYRESESSVSIINSKSLLSW